MRYPAIELVVEVIIVVVAAVRNSACHVWRFAFPLKIKSWGAPELRHRSVLRLSLR